MSSAKCSFTSIAVSSLIISLCYVFVEVKYMQSGLKAVCLLYACCFLNTHFPHATLCQHGVSYGPVSSCLFIIRSCHTGFPRHILLVHCIVTNFSDISRSLASSL